jgi:hypothetical protein
VLLAVTCGIATRKNIGNATSTSKAANVPKSRILPFGTEFFALRTNEITVSAVSEMERLIADHIEPDSN